MNPSCLQKGIMKNQALILDFEKLDQAQTLKIAETVISCDRLSPERVISLFLNSGFHHVVQKSSPDFVAESAIAESMIQHPDHFLQFPMSVLFAEKNPNLDTERSHRDLSWQVSDPKEKRDLLTTVDEYMKKNATPQSLAQDAKMVVDEIITNALHHGPFVGSGITGPSSEQIRQSLGSDPKKWPQVFVGRTAERIFVGCSDFNGSLNLEKMIKRIQFAFISGPGEIINFGRGGARIGAFMMFECCTSFYAAVDEGKITTIVCGFPQRKSAKVRHEMPKNLHLIWRKKSS